MKNRFSKYIKEIPHKPGIYIYKDKLKKIIYVGKAIDLKKRVSQYFNTDTALGPKTKTLVSKIDNISYQVVGSEVEALVLEANLIKIHRPKYNSQLTDDKNYLYICISHDTYPRIFSAHFSKLDNQKYDTYGPFPDSSSVKYILKTIRSIFPYRSFVKIHPKNCLYCHLGLCPGSNPNKLKYQKNIKKIKSILSGHIKKIIDKLQTEMFACSKTQDYENALIKKKQIESLVYITSTWKNINKLTNSINLAPDKYIQALQGLKIILSKYVLVNKINRLEAYDISNSAGKYFVGSMVVFQNNSIDNSKFRKFKIRSKTTQDDQYMIKEVVLRRLKHINWTYPDIIIVDGGKPQVSALTGHIPQNIVLLGLAKKEELIILKIQNKWHTIKLPKYSNTLRLLQHMRDEAHRFANYYRLQLVKLNNEN